MKYVSTRGAAPELSFEDVLLTGLAVDGGLYVPKTWPHFTPDQLRAMQTLSYQDIAFQVMWPFVGDSFTAERFRELIDEAYSRFSHKAVVPLKQLESNLWLMELFQGPTLAFKDVALQLLGLMFDEILTRSNRRVTIVGATSGDTGSAAIEACRGRRSIDIFILHPHGRTSEVQRRQMTTVTASNVHNIALKGSFDDCQDAVKAMFANADFRRGVGLSAVNSINWARIMAQTVYYVVAAVRLGAPDRDLDVVVPTGNFGNVFAAYAAKKTGVNLNILGIASNRNDILTRFFQNNDMSIGGVEPSLSPSMDIQVSSNFERLLFDMLGRDGHAVEKTMQEFRATGKMTVPQGIWQAVLQDGFGAQACDDGQTRAGIKYSLEAYGELIDPHTATGIHMARRQPDTKRPVVVMATAHPAKFPDAVKVATGIHPELPDALADLFDRPEHFSVLDKDQKALESFIKQRIKKPDFKQQGRTTAV